MRLMSSYVPVLLAAGLGTRMNSNTNKVLHKLAGHPLLEYTLQAVEAIPSVLASSSDVKDVFAHSPVVVLRHKAEQVEKTFKNRCFYVRKDKPSGTGGSVLAAKTLIENLDPLPDIVLVCCGDTPLIRSEILARMLTEHLKRNATITFITAESSDPKGFGRILRDEDGQVMRILEEKQATEDQKLIAEINCGVYCFDRSWLWPQFPNLLPTPAGEYYLTDLVEIAVKQGKAVHTVRGTSDDAVEINDRVQLATTEQLLRQRILAQHMLSGVTILDPNTTYIDKEAKIGMDTLILPNTFILGNSDIGSFCVIGPNVTIERSFIGDSCRIGPYSIIENSSLERKSHVEPFSYLLSENG
jgi:bifunctional UDP-N-acetylglucosamine pyrophosphorylase / glucosamine-1-phosphate N-acetyltransferase